MDNIHGSIAHLAVPIATLVHLENNPRKGDIGAIVASYREFGQVKPIVVKTNGDGTSTVIAGNHQLRAARQLGWTEIAVVEFDGDDEKAIAYALTDNRTNELGSVDSTLLYELLGEVGDQYTQLIDSLGWDEFEIASMEGDYFADDDSEGYIQPVIQPIATTPVAPVAPSAISTTNDEGEVELTAPEGTNTKQAITQGAPSVVANGSKTIVQYTLVFDSAEQQRKWYDFVRWLKTDTGTDGDTTAERILNFIDAHANY